MSILKSIVIKRESDSRSIKKRNLSSPSSLTATPDQPLTSSESMEPAKKRVRWTTDLPGGPASAGSMQVTTPEASVSSAAGGLRECMEKMEHKIHQIARKELALLNQSKKLRQARSIMTSRYQKLNTLQKAAGGLRKCMEIMEHKIHQIARKELALLNQSKKLRQARRIMTSRYQKLNTLQKALRGEDPSAITDAPTTLPPVFSAGSSRNPALIDLTE
jgi:hypothetical protein